MASISIAGPGSANGNIGDGPCRSCVPCVLSIYILNVYSYLRHSLFNGNTDLSVLLKYVFYGSVFSIITSLFSGTLLVNTSVFFLLLAFSILYINVRTNDDFAGSSD